MATRIIVSLAIVVAMVLTLAPNSDVGGTLSLLLVVLGAVYAGLQQEKDFHIQPASHRFFCS